MYILIECVKFDEYEENGQFQIFYYLLYMQYLFIFITLQLVISSPNTSKTFSRFTDVLAARYHQRQLLNVLEIHSSLCRFSSHFILFIFYIPFFSLCVDEEKFCVYIFGCLEPYLEQMWKKIVYILRMWEFMPSGVNTKILSIWSGYECPKLANCYVWLCLVFYFSLILAGWPRKLRRFSRSVIILWMKSFLNELLHKEIKNLFNVLRISQKRCFKIEF